MSAYKLRAFQVGKALISDGGPSSSMRPSPVALGPGELAGVPFDEGFGFRRDVEVLLEAGVRLASIRYLRTR